MSRSEGTSSPLKKVVGAVSLAVIGTVVATWIFRSEPAIEYGIKSWLHPAALSVVINEIKSDGQDDWVELYNPGTEPASIGGFGFRDDDATHEIYIIPARTVIEPGEFFVLDEVDFRFGLGDDDAAILFAWGATKEVDSYKWTKHATKTTYGRCPDGEPRFVTTAKATKKAANACDGQF